MPQFGKNINPSTQAHAVVCILAHNEETNIADTLMSIIDGNRDIELSIKVYANGCTDNTHKIVSEISITHPSVELVIIEKASKTNAWNTAFQQNRDSILIFSDADIVPEPGSVSNILRSFAKNRDIEIANCEMWPASDGLSWQQKLTGFMLIPLKQDFLNGSFYGIRRSAFVSHFKQIGISGLPEGITGEDAFLDALVPRNRFICVKSKVLFKPPEFNDYYKYLARLKWQSAQLQHFHNITESASVTCVLSRLLNKVMYTNIENKGIHRLFTGCTAAITRTLFMKLRKSRIEKEYQKLGPVTADGSWVLSDATRSASVK